MCLSTAVQQNITYIVTVCTVQLFGVGAVAAVAVLLNNDIAKLKKRFNFFSCDHTIKYFASLS